MVAGVVVGVLLVVTGVLSWQRRLERNWFVGVRLPVTTKSAEAWEAAHRAAAPAFVTAGVLALAGAALAPTWPEGPLAGITAAVLATLVATVLAVRAARDVP